jgi:hypothetical protein
MQAFNLALFLLEAVIYFSVMTAFLHFRRQLGLGVFLAALGVMHFMETYLAAVFYIDLPFGTVSPGSSVFFAGKLMMILLLYLKEDAAVVRQPIYGLFLGNLLTVGIAQLLQAHEVVALPGGRAADMVFLSEMGWLMVWGTALLYVDAIGIILLYERLGRVLGGNVVLRFAISGAAILTFDQIGFYSGLNILFGAPPSVFFGGWYAKLLSVVLYSLLFAAYLKIEQIPRLARSTREITDIFNDLTFRERYQALLAKSGVDGLTGLLDRGRLEADVPTLIHRCLDRGTRAQPDHHRRGSFQAGQRPLRPSEGGRGAEGGCGMPAGGLAPERPSLPLRRRGVRADPARYRPRRRPDDRRTPADCDLPFGHSSRRPMRDRLDRRGDGSGGRTRARYAARARRRAALPRKK